MKTTNLTDLAVNVEANAFSALLDGGFIDICGGKQPDSANAPMSGQKRAVTLAFGSPAFGPSKAGVIVANKIAPGVSENSVNPVTWARIYRSDHKTPVMDVSVGTRDAVVILPTVNIPANITVTCSSFSHVIPSRSTE